MASTEERIRKLVDENLEVDGRPLDRPLSLDSSLRDSGVSSVDFVAFIKLVSQDFGVDFAPEDCVNIQSVGELVAFLDAKAS